MIKIILCLCLLFCFSGIAPAVPNGYPMPLLQDEKDTYTRWGWTWSSTAEPNYPAATNYRVNDPDIHGDTEGDDLWTSLMMYLRTGENGYLDRATEWARYFKEDFRACNGGSYSNYCYDLNAFGGCHTWGWGLVAWYEYNQDAAALTEAESLAAVSKVDYPARQDPEHAHGFQPLEQPVRHVLLRGMVDRSVAWLRGLCGRRPDHLSLSDRCTH
jgi:hypothetical protein